MAREIFCTSEVGETLNKYFVNIKVDKEEHPDESIYDC
ncbi:MAG: DUF255 domain-containing protein [Rickettsiales endosymbiont of Dermacentor nuttalli]